MHMLIDGVAVEASGDGVLQVTNPATGGVIDTVPEASREQFDLAIAAARGGAVAWACVPVHERVSVLRRFAGLLDEHAERIATLLTTENGKPLGQARAEVAGSVRMFRSYAEEALRLYGTVIPGGVQEGFERDLITIHREPFGVLGAILPFNFPVDLFTHKVAPALATGNAVVVKPAENAPLAVLEVVRLLHDAGVPGNVLQVVTGSGRTVGSWLANSVGIDLVSFTGSTDVGIAVAQAAARRLTPTFLELGGNDPLIVFPDADLDATVADAIDSRLLCNGQCCCATKRLIVHRDIAGDLVDVLGAKLAALRVGDPRDSSTDVGPLIDERAADRAAEHVAVAVSQGARLAVGDGTANRAYFAPTLLVDVDRKADMAGNTEVFAPTLPVIEFGELDEAVSIANQTHYGLNAAVFTADLGLGLRVAKRLESGTVVVNGGTTYRPDAIPFGGYKLSGLGREGVTVTLQEFTQPKTISLRSVF